MNYQDNRWWILTGTGLAALLVAMDYSIVNTVLANLERDLHAHLGELQWFMAGFGLAFCALLATAGRLADIMGRRKFFYISIIVFALGSIGAGLSQTPWQMILFRVIQGFGGAGVFPCGTAITVDAFPPDQHGRAMGIYGSILGFGLALGPVVGGIIVSIENWRWIFFINIPIILLSLLITFTFVRESKLATKIPIDWWGALFLFVGTSTLVYAITSAPTASWASTKVILSLIMSAIGLGLFFYIEKNTEAPLLPLGLLKNKGFLLGSLIFVTGVSFSWPLIFVAPLYIHNALGYSTLATSLLIMPLTGMTAFAPILAGYMFDTKGPRVTIILTFLTIIFGLGLQTFFSIHTPMLLLFVAFLLFGFGWGSANGIAMPMALSEHPDTDNAGIITGAMLTILNVVGVLALTIVVMLFRYSEASSLWRELKAANISLSHSQAHGIRTLLSDPDSAVKVAKGFGIQIGEEVLRFFKIAFTHGYRMGITFLLISSIVIFLIVLRALRPKPRTYQ